MLRFRPIVGLLFCVSKSAVAAATPISLPLTLDKLQAYLVENPTITKADFLKNLPNEYRTHAVLIRQSLSRHVSDDAHPRVISWGVDACIPRRRNETGGIGNRSGLGSGGHDFPELKLLSVYARTKFPYDETYRDGPTVPPSERFDFDAQSLIARAEDLA